MRLGGFQPVSRLLWALSRASMVHSGVQGCCEWGWGGGVLLVRGWSDVAYGGIAREPVLVSHQLSLLCGKACLSALECDQ